MSYITKKELYPYVVLQGPTSVESGIALSLDNLQKIFNTISDEGKLNSSGQSCYDHSNGTYTVPVKGLYSFSFMLNCTNNSATGDDSINLGFTITKSGVSTIKYIDVCPEQLSTTTGNNTEYQFGFSLNTILNVNDTVALYANGATALQNYLANQSYYYITMLSALN